MPSLMTRSASRSFKRIGFEDVLPPVRLVKSLIEAGTFVMVFGPSGAKKSLLVYDLACCIAADKGWHGHRVKQGRVLIIVGEGHSGLNRRLKGWEKHKDTSFADVPLYRNDKPLILRDNAHIAALVAILRSGSALMASCAYRCRYAGARSGVDRLEIWGRLKQANCGPDRGHTAIQMRRACGGSYGPLRGSSGQCKGGI